MQSNNLLKGKDIQAYYQEILTKIFLLFINSRSYALVIKQQKIRKIFIFALFGKIDYIK
jgi:hypothetical protein